MRVGPLRGTYDEAITHGRTLIDAQPEEPPLGCSDVGVDHKGSRSRTWAATLSRTLFTVKRNVAP